MIKRCSSCSAIQSDEKVVQCRNCGMPFEGYSSEVGTAQALHQIARNTGTMKNIMLICLILGIVLGLLSFMIGLLNGLSHAGR